MQYSSHVNAKKTPQTKPIPGREKEMVQNSAGGFTFKLDPWMVLRRFLILGTEGGTYYAKERELTEKNAQNVIELIRLQGPLVVNEILSISQNGRAHKNDATIFALALCTKYGDAPTKKLAYDAISKVCRTGTHIFQFCQSVQDLRGWSRGLRSGVAKYYMEKTAQKLDLDLIKYRQRNGWTHKDVVRLSHPRFHPAKYPQQANAMKWLLGKNPELVPNRLIEAFELAQKIDHKKLPELILTFALPREALPTEALKNLAVWRALLERMPMHAMVRNLGVMTSVGLLQSNFDHATKHVFEQLTDAKTIRESKLHPISVLLALKTYSQGHGFKGKLSWNPVAKVLEGLDRAFYLAFQNVEPTNKNFLLGIDVSGSMGSSKIANTNLSAREAAMAMALVTAEKEPNHELYAFSNTFMKMTIRKGAPLDIVCREVERIPFSTTDCSLPMVFATQHNLPIDVFVVYTDNETFAGRIHPKQALDQYRQRTGRNAKCIVVGMTATDFTIADPNDPGMMDIVGFDASAPVIMNEFIVDHQQ